MKKHITGTLAATAALLAIAGLAQAAPAELNIYGASAQYDFWNAQAQNFAQTTLGCTATAPVNNSKKHGFVHATACTSTLVPQNAANNNSRDLDIRYSGIASAEGPLAVKKAAPLDATLATGCNVANGERLMYDTDTTLVCKQVHVGTSDVPGEALIQSSNGEKFGPNGGGNFVVNLSGVNTAGLVPHSTVVVPFGFFVNEGVTARKCSTGLVGNYCTAATQCDTAPGKLDGACDTTASTITNISRMQAAQIFSGQAADWSDFGAFFTPKQIVACLRHAGSGTHSTLDFAVLNAGGTGWGSQMAVLEDQTGFAGKLIDGGAPKIWFNQGSTDMVQCIDGYDAVNTTGQVIGAIGYADADQAIGVAGKSEKVKQLAYNGVYPSRTAIRNGLYDFYSPAMLYTNLTNPAANNAIAESMITFAKNPVNIPSTKANYWAAASEMSYMRKDVTKYPSFVGASIPTLP